MNESHLRGALQAAVRVARAGWGGLRAWVIFNHKVVYREGAKCANDCGLIKIEIIEMETGVTSKGRILIPTPLRRKYGIRGGTRIIVFDNGDSIVLKPMTEKYLRKLQGSLKGRGGLKTLLDDKHIEAK